MITYIDIREAIDSQLYKTGIKRMSRDVQEGFNRPSFFVQLDNVSSSGNTSQVERSMTVRIYFFPSDRYEYSIEVLEMQEQLDALFDLKLQVRKRWLNIIEPSSFLNDGILNYTFDLEFEFGREKEKDIEHEDLRENYPIEDMEVLNYEQE